MEPTSSTRTARDSRPANGSLCRSRSRFWLAHNLNAENLFPKGIEILAAKEHYDVLVNMSGRAISIPGARVLHWQVEDPIGKSEEVFGAIAGQVERLVQRLVLDLRQGA